MKIPGSDDNSSKVRRSIAENVQANEAAGKGNKKTTSIITTDNVSLSSLGNYLKEDFSAQKMADERQEKVERLKALVNLKAYHVDSLALASAIDEEISLEVLLGNKGA